MKNTYLLIGALFFVGCSTIKPTKIVGTYKSTCVLYTEPEVIATFNSDNSFIYNLPFKEQATGKWFLNGDTLVLHSEKFQTKDPLAPSYKCTDLEGNRDAYLVKGKKLYPINKEGHTRKCYFKRQ